MTKRFGFTLAEVLITLGIIGVVAAMTIPTLMNQTGQAEFRTGFKKIISTLNQAVTMNVALDSTDFAALSTNVTTAGSASLYNLFSSRMNVIRTATDGAGLDGASSKMATTGNYTLFFNDGMAISFPNTKTQCTSVTIPTTACVALVDVNGSKKPNKQTVGTNTTTLVIGDQFGVIMYDQQVLPNGEAAKLVMFQ